ncbi:MAG: hypothetical protein KAQ92_01955, partial [Candidatus Aenigmarchaeota archaeon]|nr:hypothetical protein [Candidatus Aenigmarchaeota archaeon]
MNKNFIKTIKNSLKTALTVLFVAVIIVILWFLVLKDILTGIEAVTYDWRARIATEQNLSKIKFSRHDPNIVILAANDDTTKILGNYPEINPGRWP